MYPPEKTEEARERIKVEERPWLRQRGQLQEQVDGAELPTSRAMNIQISCPAIDFSDEVTKLLLRDRLNSLHFTGQPKDACVLQSVDR